MWIALAGTGASTIVFALLYFGERKRNGRLREEHGRLERANEQFQIEIERGQSELRGVIQSRDRECRQNRRRAQQCAANFEALALAGQTDPAVVDRLVRDLEQLFVVSDTETTFGGD